MVLLEGPAGDAVAIESVWDTAADADAFAAAAKMALTARALTGTVVHVAGSTRVSLAIGTSSTTVAGFLPG
jgi:hypothetical protein